MNGDQLKSTLMNKLFHQVHSFQWLISKELPNNDLRPKNEKDIPTLVIDYDKHNCPNMSEDKSTYSLQWTRTKLVVPHQL